MKTRFAKKETRKEFEVLSAKEMKQVQGGVEVIAVRDSDGHVRVIIVP